MPEPTPAVFLSYASQDAEAATRIAASLRSAGIEVWFDVEGGLEQGDEWDAKIRNQIKDCVLFIAVVSANTQARHEGYFRIEWELAAQRAMGIASGVPFILPVTIDATDEQTALVPDRFKAVQWTKLPDGEVSDKVQARFLKLWSQRTGSDVGASLDDARAPEATARRREATPLPNPSRQWLIPTLIGAIAVVALAILRPLQPADNPEPTPTTAASTADSAIQPLIDRMWAIFDNADNSTDDEWALADELGAQATAEDPLNSEAWAAWANVIVMPIIFGSNERSDSRLDRATRAAERSLSLDPDSVAAQIAVANCYRWSDATKHEAARLARKFAADHPSNKRALRMAGNVVKSVDKFEEAIGYFDQAIALPGDSRAALFGKERILLITGQFSEAEAIVDQLIAMQSGPAAYLHRAELQLLWHHNLDSAEDALSHVPASFLKRHYGAGLATDLRLWQRKPELCLAALDALIGPTIYGAPKEYFRGLAHEMAQRPAAAEVEWKTALQRVEEKLTTTPNDILALRWKGLLLAFLGEENEAKRVLETYSQMVPADNKNAQLIQAIILTQLGETDDAYGKLEELTKNPPEHFQDLYIAANIRFSPEFDPLRNKPEFSPLFERLAKRQYDVVTDSDTSVSIPAKSIAVLPFANLSPDAENAFFADGMHEDILTTLTNVRELKVISRTSTLRYRDNTRPLREVATELGVAHVLQGSVRRAGNRVRISAQLIEAATDENVWAETFDRDLDDIFAIQSEVAQRIAEALHAVISPEERVRIDKLPTQNRAAYDLYLRGRSLWNTISKENNDEARRLFRAAIALDPEFALAWSALADTYVIVLSGAMDEPATVLAEGRPALERALALDPNLAEAHLSLAVLLKNHEWDWDGAEREFQRALELNDRVVSVHHQYGWFLYHRQRHEEALVHFQLAVDLDPQAPLLRLDLAAPLEQMARLDEAMTHIQSAFAIDPDFQWGYAIEGQNWLKRGNWERARDSLHRARKPGSPDPIVLAWSVLAAANIGSTEAREEAHDTLRQLQELRSTRYVEPYALALAYTALNEPDKAFAFLNEAYKEGGISLLFLPMDPFLDPLRNDPRFQEIYDKMNFDFPEDVK